MTEPAPAHQHRFRDAVVSDAHGKPTVGKRCPCGMETIGRADVIRASQRLQDAMVQALLDLARRVSR